MILAAPARPKLRERATAERALALFVDNFAQSWGEFDADKLQADMIAAVNGATDVWVAAKWLESLGWPFDHDTYMLFCGFWRSLETARIEREIEWVASSGCRFPANTGQTIVFSHRGSRLTGLIEDVDRVRARAFVKAKRYGKSSPETFVVLSEYVMMVQVDG